MDLKDLKSGEGSLVDYNGKKIAAYKDEDGKIFAVAEKCTYEGCTLNWNQQEKIWVCPCCGSKYDIEGKVLNGPATENLKKINL